MAKAGKIAVRPANKDCVIVKMDGAEIVVPTTRMENAFQNMMLAAVQRQIIFEAMRQWKDRGVLPTPKEMADIARASKDIAAFSAEMYGSDPVDPPPERKEDGGSDVDFSKLTQVKPIDVKTEEKKDEPRDTPKTESG